MPTTIDNNNGNVETQHVQHYNGEKQLEKHSSSSSKKCKHCNQNFHDDNAPILCEWCRDRKSSCHMHEAIAIGEYNQYALCPGCVESTTWQCKDENVQEVHALVKQTDSQCIFSVSCKTTRSILQLPNGIIFKKRFWKISTNRAKQIVHNFQSLQSRYNNRNKVVRYNIYDLKLRKWYQQYKTQYGLPNVHGVEKMIFPEFTPILISNMGTIEFNGFVILPAILEHITTAIVICKRLKCKHDAEFPYTDKCIDLFELDLAHHYCSSTYAHDTTVMMSLGKAYKGKTTCFALKNDLDIDIEKRKTNGSHHYKYGDKDKTKNLIKVIKSELDEYFNKDEHKVFRDDLQKLKFIQSVMQFAIQQQFPALNTPFAQFASNGLIHGTEMNDIDVLKYLPKHETRSHVDAKELVERQYNGKILQPGPYCIAKINSQETQILCNVSNKNSRCCFNHETGGHAVLPPYSLYFMFNNGAYGGPTHAIHGQHGKRLQTVSHTVVMRPYVNKIAD